MINDDENWDDVKEGLQAAIGWLRRGLDQGFIDRRKTGEREELTPDSRRQYEAQLAKLSAEHRQHWMSA